VYFASFAALFLIVSWRPLTDLFSFSLGHEYYSHFVLIPFLSAGLIYFERARTFRTLRFGLVPGILLIFMGTVLYLLSKSFALTLDRNDYLSVLALSIVTLWMGGFILCYGPLAFRAAAFPLLFLLLIVPLPGFLLHEAIYLLQKGSAECVYILFRTLGVPVFREGFVFALPGVTIQIAEECSGIRSSIALVITCGLAGYLFLHSTWKRILFVAFTVPLVIVKNGIRIVTLSVLSIYVNPDFLRGHLHRDGGVLFFILAVTVSFLVLRFQQKLEARSPRSSQESSRS
jgi:exosortase